ncbi:hypothetical protein FA95DRAFT_1574934 [Auriscalpium vulgare]|uniref:Uncharacterized protein n=1 Tax=Auriscalpium vulgare TaxID=40419 RepID=A0ACB8RJE0_9AGAM|nr:hypothetical protein FA95DRAFT_1574934 [Auriscalpium vulgare]
MSAGITRRPYADAQVDEAVALCLKAYDGDIANNILTGGDPALADPAWRALVRAGNHSGVVFVASSDGSDEIQSIGIWFPPGQTVFSTPEQRELGFLDFINAMPPAHRDWFLNDYSRKTREFKLRVLGENTERDAWYANLIATHPKYQGRGLASEILKTACQIAAADNKNVVLGTQNEENAVFYRNRGFTEVGRMDEPTPWGVFTGNMFIRKPPSA